MRQSDYKSLHQTPMLATKVSITVGRVRHAFQRDPFVPARSENNTDTRTVVPAADRQACPHLRCVGFGNRCSSPARARVPATGPKRRRLLDRPSQILPGQLAVFGAHRAIRERSCPSAACSPERGVSGDKKFVAPHPRRYGTIVQNPAALTMGTTSSNARASYG